MAEMDGVDGGVECLKADVLTLSQELEKLRMGHSQILQATLLVQGLLHKLCNNKVRQDFIDGRLGVFIDEVKILQSLDIISSVLLPSPSKSQVKVAQEDDDVVFLGKLLSRDSSQVIVEGRTLPYRQTYAEWRDFIYRLVSHDYWAREGYQLSTHSVNVSNLGKDQLDLGMKSEVDDLVRKGLTNKVAASGGKVVGDLPGCSSTDDCSGKPYKPPSKSDSRRRESRVSRKKRISRSTSESTSSSGESDSSVPNDRFGRGRRSHRRVVGATAEAFQSLRAKEVVSPCVYSPESGVSFRRFLRDYERYFDAKFNGTSRDKSRHLCNFLAGSLRRAYDAVGGQYLKYRVLKAELLDVYNAERVSTEELKYEEFQRAKPHAGESLLVYCLRLEQIASRAFPGAAREQDRQLIRHFKQTVSRSFLSKLEGLQSTLALIGERKISWAQIKQLAESSDRCARESGSRGRLDRSSGPEAEVWYSRGSAVEGFTEQGAAAATPANRSGADQTSTSYSRYSPANSAKNPEPYSSVQNKYSRFNSSRRFDRSSLWCSWCGRKNHVIAKCWEKNGCCLGCGDPTHTSLSCPGKKDGTRLTCPNCRGNHLGKDCPPAGPSGLNC